MNIYQQKDPQKFAEIIEIVQKQQLCIHTFMKSRKDMLEWMRSVVHHNINKLPDYSPSTLVYWIVNGLQDYPKCQNKNCNNQIIKNVKTFEKGFDLFCCRSCSTSDEHTREKHRKTSLQRHGEEHFTNRKKAFATTQQHFGCKCGFQSPKALQALKEKYGVEYYQQCKEFRKKSKKTMLDKYGVENIQQLPNVHRQAAQKVFERYGDYNNHAKYIQTMKEKYGVICNFQLESHRKMMHDRKDELQAKKKKTLMEHYGIECTPSFKYVFNSISFDSGVELAYYIWLKEHDKDFTYHPDKFFEYKFNEKTKRYFPDFIVEGQFVELKGDQFFEDKDPSKRMICPYNRKADDLYEAKRQCMLANGVQILTSKDYMQYEKYVEEKYGKGYIKSFQKNFQRSDFFRSK